MSSKGHRKGRNKENEPDLNVSILSNTIRNLCGNRDLESREAVDLLRATLPVATIRRLYDLTCRRDGDPKLEELTPFRDILLKEEEEERSRAEEGGGSTETDFAVAHSPHTRNKMAETEREARSRVFTTGLTPANLTSAGPTPPKIVKEDKPYNNFAMYYKQCNAFSGIGPKLEVDSNSPNIKETLQGLLINSSTHLSASRLGRIQAAVITFFLRSEWTLFNSPQKRPWKTLCPTLFGMDSRRVAQFTCVGQLVYNFPRLITSGASIDQLYQDRGLFTADEMSPNDLAYFSVCPAQFGPLLPLKHDKALYHKHFI